MVGALFLGVLLAVLIYFLLRSIASVEPATLLRAARLGVVGLLIVVIVVLVATGRGAIAFSLMMLALPFIPGILKRLRQSEAFARMLGGGDGQSTTAETRFLAMVLEHGTGIVDGIVLIGPCAGRRLGTLSAVELTELWAYYLHEDLPSAEMLEAYLDRVHPGWRESESAADDKPPSRGGAMTRAEAFKLLGLDDEASETEIRDAHRRLIARVHPDHGGSAYLAAEINRARDVLLGKSQ